jgi:glutathionylspermidine synthase
MHPIRLARPLDGRLFGELRREMELRHCKWDAQVGDLAALAPTPLVIEPETWNELAESAEALAAETEALEAAVLERPDLFAMIGLPRTLRAVFAGGECRVPSGARVLRFDFHWTTEGWRVSEVNSDVPGGYTEATSFTHLVAAHVPRTRTAGNPTAALIDAILRRRDGDARVALINAPGHMEDHQVVAYLAARIRERGVGAEVVAPSHIRWIDGKARIENQWCRAPVSAIVRFYQVEWLARLPRPLAAAWRPMFAGGRTPIVNTGTAALTESKRLPLVWDRLSVPVPTWRRLLPETRPLAAAPWAQDEGWILKTAYCNTGDTVTMRSALPASEWRWRAWSARLRPRAWVAQRRFETVPIADHGVRVFPCIGVYTVDGTAVGAYARVSETPVIDYAARDAALLISETPAKGA